ncbi:unnamed protein product [Paramecium primaurelia]|uniref:Uncharacterized protein n=1 Tax=Paramecium primaurelia TaxID=5886 RepID=A0A8S1JPL7_PARPR|nr:unnamed protein product [Paramecium primaurelia]
MLTQKKFNRQWQKLKNKIARQEFDKNMNKQLAMRVAFVDYFI